MAENVTLARPYAEAVFSLASETGALEAWSDLLARLALVAADPQIQACLGNPLLSPVQLAQLLAGSAGRALSTEEANFVEALVANERIQVLPEIRDLYEDLRCAHEGIKDACVTSAFPIEASALEQLKAEIEARFASRLRVHVEIDPELIGGVRIAVGDEVIDASVRAKLAALSAALQN